jgi:Skp family chaperone for outer membrane proteins
METLAMIKRPFMCILAAAAVIGISSAAQAQQKATGVAVVDVQKAFDALREKTQVEAELTTAADLVKTEDGKRQAKLRELDQDLKIMAVGTPPYEKKQEELERAALDRQVWLQFQQGKLNRERAVRIEAIYKKMIETIGRVAQANGYKLVLFKEQDVNLGSISKPEQISAIIGSRKVLWSSDELDLTDQVVQRLNNDFNTGAKP